MSWIERKKRTGIMLAYPFEEQRLAKWNPPYICQPKLDGVRCRAVWNGRSFVLASSTEELITSVPHMNELLNRWMGCCSSPLFTELDGELWIPGRSFEDVYSITARTVNLHPDHEQVEYHIFDFIDPELPQHLRSLDLMNARQEFSRTGLKKISFVPHLIASNLDEVLAHYEAFLRDGYEGIIIRHVDAPYVRKRATTMMKFKPRKSDVYEIIGFVEECDKYGRPKDSLGALICQGDDGEPFNVGSGFTADQRQVIWDARNALRGAFVLVKYQHLTPGRGVPRFPVFCKLINSLKEAGDA